VTTAFGLERGRALLLPGANFDVVQLHGRDAAKVRDVTLENAKMTELTGTPPSTFVEFTPLDATGTAVHTLVLAHQVQLTNPNTVPVRVRLVLMVLRVAQPGVPQQASLIRNVTTVSLKAKETTEVDLDVRTRSILAKLPLSAFALLRPVIVP
jgi:hypothetical protein